MPGKERKKDTEAGLRGAPSINLKEELTKTKKQKQVWCRVSVTVTVSLGRVTPW